MKSIFLVKPGTIELRDVPVPTPVDGELVIKIETALTCGTDLKAFRRGHPKMPMPTQFGHEFSGTIAAVGTSPNGYREGDAIMGVHTAPCGQCYYCERQRENLCPDTMANMVMGAYGARHAITRNHRTRHGANHRGGRHRIDAYPTRPTERGRQNTRAGQT